MGLNQFRANQIVDKDNTTKTELAPLGLNNNIYLAISSSGLTDAYTFDEGSGTTATDSVGSADLTTSANWGSGYLSIDSSSQTWQSAVGAYQNLTDSWSMAVWVEFTASQSGYYLELGDGNFSGYSSASFYGTVNTSSQILEFDISNGVNDQSSVYTTGGNLLNSKILAILTYQKNSSVSNTNVLALKWTSDGSTWYGGSGTALNTTAYPMYINPSHALRHNVYPSSISGVRYYRLDMFNGTVLSDSDMQTLWDAGSEAPVNTGGKITVPSSAEVPATLTISNQIYSNTSDASVTLTGSAGKRHIFAIAQNDKTFTLDAVLATDTNPANSRFIGAVTWDGSQITSIDSSLSKLIEKESISIGSSQNSVTLSEISYNDNDIPMIFVNGNRDSNITITSGNVVEFTTSLTSGDYVDAVKIRNSSTFERPNVMVPADYEWLFNDGSGTTGVAAIGSENLNIVNPVWGSGYVDLSSFNTTSSYFQTTTATDLWGNLQTFSIATWVTPLKDFTNSSGAETFLTIGNGSTDLNNWNIYATSASGDKISWAVSQGIYGGPGTGLTSGVGYTTSDKILVVMTYKYNSSGNDNEMTLRTTVDGVTWDVQTSSTAVPIPQKSGYQLRSAFSNAGYLNGSWRHYRLDVYNNYVLTANDAQAIWNKGSEG